MTPYVITHGYRPPGPGASLEPHARRAATTLEKVHEATKAIIDDLPPDHDAQRDWSDHYAAAMVDEDGGTIDLPDGTVIEVTLIADEYPYDWLVREAGISRLVGARMTRDEIVDAYNARST